LTSGGAKSIWLSTLLLRQIENAIHERQDPLQPVFRQQDRQPQVGVEPHQRVQHIFGRLRVKLGCRLVQRQNARAQRQGRGDGHALTLAARQRLEQAVAQRRKVEQIQRLLDAHTHLLGRHRRVLQRKGDLILDPLHDKLRLWVLKDKADMTAEHTRRRGHRIQPGHAHAPPHGAARKMGRQPVKAAQQRRFA
jgi:hypothetical protein